MDNNGLIVVRKVKAGDERSRDASAPEENSGSHTNSEQDSSAALIRLSTSVSECAVEMIQ